VARAIERMRAFFARRGIGTSAPAVVAAMHAASGQPVPQHVAGAVAAAASTPPSDAALAIAETVVTMKTWAGAKLAGGVVVGALTAAAAACVAAAVIASGEPARAPAKDVTPAAGPIAMAQDVAPVAELPGGVRVELVAVAACPPDDNAGWWDAAGRKVDPPPCDSDGDGDSHSIRPDDHHQAAIRVTAPPGASVRYHVSPSKTSVSAPAKRGGRAVEGLTRLEFDTEGADKPIEVWVRISSGDFRTLLDCRDPAAGDEAEPAAGQRVTLQPVDADGSGGARAILYLRLPEGDVRVLAIDDAGGEHKPSTQVSHQGDDQEQLELNFDLPPERVRRLRVAHRPFDKWVVFDGVSLDPQRPGRFRVTAGTDPTTQPGR
jgi:hypothetical protein